MHGRITRNPINIAGIAGNFGAAASRKWQKNGSAGGYARYFGGYARYLWESGLGGDACGDSCRAAAFGVRAPVHGDKAGGLFDPA